MIRNKLLFVGIIVLVFAIALGSCNESKKTSKKTVKLVELVKTELNVKLIITEFPSDTLMELPKDESYHDLKDLLLSNADFTNKKIHHSDGVITEKLFNFLYGDENKHFTPKQKLDMLFLFGLCYKRECENYRANLYGRIMNRDTAVINNPIYILPLIEVDNCSTFWQKFLLSRKSINSPKVYATYSQNVLTILNSIQPKEFSEFFSTIQERIKGEKYHILKYNPLVLEYLKKSQRG